MVDDCSTDNTYEIIKTIHTIFGNFNMLRNEIRVGTSLATRVKGLEFISKKNEEYIIINIDGDDYLPDKGVFSYLNVIYQDEDIYMTYGQYEPESHTYHNYCKPLYNTRTYRKSGEWVTSHLRTYRKKIFDLIKDEDLRDVNNNYYKTGDIAVMLPLIELCGLKRIKFISKILYIYNDLNSICTMNLNPDKQVAEANEIRNKPEYEELLYNI